MQTIKKTPHTTNNNTIVGPKSKSTRKALSTVDKNVQRHYDSEQKRMAKGKELQYPSPSATTPPQRSLATSTAPSPTSRPSTRHRTHSQRSQSVPTLPSLEHLSLGEDTSFQSQSESVSVSRSSSSELLVSSSSEFDELSLYVSGSEEDFTYPGSASSSSGLSARPGTFEAQAPKLEPPRKVNNHRRSRSYEEEKTLKGVVYSTGGGSESKRSSPPPTTRGKLHPLGPIAEEFCEFNLLHTQSIPDSGLLEEEEWLGPTPPEEFDDTDEDCEFGEVKSEFITTSVSPPVFFPDPPSVQRKRLMDQGPIPTRDAPPPPPPPPPPPRRPSLAEISRAAILSRMLATKPITSSLLSLGEGAEPIPRVHQQRQARVRHGSDILRKQLLRNLHLIHERGLTAGNTYKSPTASSPSCPPVAEMYSKPYLFPRCGDLKDLRVENSSSLMDDWRHGWVDLLTVQRLAWNFDMHVRSGDWIWGELPAVEQLGIRDWELEWSKRWKVVEWLLEYR